ncbi:MAG: hypothetical protein ABI534_09960 [Chloroflexota bacterium]
MPTAPDAPDAASNPPSTLPDGITDEHSRAATGWRRATSVVPLVLLSALMLAALLGFAGHETTLTVTANGATVTWHAPERIRNGELLEMRLRVISDERVGQLIVEIPIALWEDMTVNTMLPAATSEASEDGVYRFDFGPLESGTAFAMKADAQLNPDIFGPNAGTIRILDGDAELVTVPVTIEVLP